MNGGRLEVVSELCSADMVAAAKTWIGPLRETFPDVRMDIATLVPDGN